MIQFSIKVIYFKNIKETHKNLKAFIEKTKKSIEINFATKIDLFLKESSNEEEDNTYSEFQLPRLNNQLQANDSNVYSLIIESIVLFESIKSLIRVLRKMKIFVSVKKFKLKKRKFS